MEGARGKVNSDIILESTGPRLYSAVFKQYVTEAQDPGTSVVGNFQVGPHPLIKKMSVGAEIWISSSLGEYMHGQHKAKYLWSCSTQGRQRL